MIHADQNRSVRLVYLIMVGDTNTGQVLAVIETPSGHHGLLDDIVNGSQAHVVVIEHGIQNIEYAAKRAVTDQDQRQNELMNPGLGNGQVEQYLLVFLFGRLERLVDGRGGFAQLLVNEFAADLVLLGHTCDRLGSSYGLERQVPSFREIHLNCRAGMRGKRWRD